MGPSLKSEISRKNFAQVVWIEKPAPPMSLHSSKR